MKSHRLCMSGDPAISSFFLKIKGLWLPRCVRGGGSGLRCRSYEDEIKLVVTLDGAAIDCEEANGFVLVLNGET